MTGLPRFLIALACLVSLSVLVPSVSDARCAPVTPAVEARRARYVFEGRVESVSGQARQFRVLATWKGSPPARITVASGRRASTPQPAEVGTTWIVFASGEDDASLGMLRCGSSGLLSSRASVLQALTAARLTRIAR